MSERITRRDAVLRATLATVGFGARFAVGLKAGTSQAQSTSGDNASLNALLTAEYNALGAYDVAANLLSTPSGSDPNASAAPVVLSVVAHFHSQHQDHVDQLAATVTANGGTPISASSVTYSLPPGFKASVFNVIRLLANAEKAATFTYSDAVKNVGSQASAQMVAAIGGVQTQHFIVLYLLALKVLQTTSATQSMASDVVPASFVVKVGSKSGLDSIADFAYS